jgi:hypothetical protein
MKYNCPTIKYGRRTAAGNDFYDVLSKTDDFPADAETLFRTRLCQSVEWKGGRAEERYGDCFLFWKLSDDQILAARLSDIGSDSRNRPHSMGIEAGLLNVNEAGVPIAELLLRITQTPDWCNGTIAETGGESRYAQSIERYIKSDAQSLLLASHPYFFARNIAMIDSPEATESAPPRQAKNPSDFVIDPSPIVEIKQMPRKPMSLKKFIFTLLPIIGIFVCLLGYHWHIIQMGVKVIQELTEANSRLKSELAESKNAMQLVGEERNKAEQERDEAQTQLDGAYRQLDESQEKLAETETRLAAARKDADAGLKAENNTLKEKEEKYKKLLRRVNETIKTGKLQDVIDIGNEIDALGE